jgi:hypothetical protein
MADLAVITPTRGRPVRFDRMAESVRATTNGRVSVLGLVDDDDPMRPAYWGLRWPLQIGPRRSLSGWTNKVALEMLAGDDPPRYLASLGDDHQPRTWGWDRKLVAAIEALPGGVGIAYGNDLYQGGDLPTAWVVSAEVVRAVGWMMLPTCEHMYVDAAVLELGRACGQVVYRPDVVIEHLHPLAGKADWDDSYKASNTTARYEEDRQAFEAWRRDGLAADAAKVKALAETGARR